MSGLVFHSAQEILELPDGSRWRAVAGGGRGRRVLQRDPRGRLLAVHHVDAGGERDFMVKASEQARGGPLPPGNYRVHPPMRHPRLGPACFLEPTDESAMHGRDDFWIHGPGRRGSDGCIVPVADGRAGRGIHRLMSVLHAITPCILTVTAAQPEGA